MIKNKIEKWDNLESDDKVVGIIFFLQGAWLVAILVLHYIFKLWT